MHKMLFLAFQITRTVWILHLKLCSLDSLDPAALLQRPPSSVKPRPEVRRQSSRPWRVSSFHFLSLYRITAQILCSSFLAVVLHPARRHGILFPSDWSIFNMPRPPTPRISGPRHSTFSSLAARRPSPTYTELVEVLTDEPCKSQSSKLYESFLSGSGLRPTRRKLPFFPDRHHEVSRSWKQPFCSRLTNAAATDFNNLVGSVEKG